MNAGLEAGEQDKERSRHSTSSSIIKPLQYRLNYYYEIYYVDGTIYDKYR